MNIKQVKAFAKEQGYKDVKYIDKWRGFDVYEPIYSDTEDIAYIGLPYVILVKGDNIRMSTEEEAFAFLDDTN